MAGIMVMAVLSRNPSAKTTAVIFADIVANDTAMFDALIFAHVSADPSEWIPRYPSSSSSSSSPKSLLALKKEKHSTSIFSAVFNEAVKKKKFYFVLWFCITTLCSDPFSRAWGPLHVVSSNSDWFIGLSASVVIG